jgi:CheY-like chemotaxis protein
VPFREPHPPESQALRVLLIDPDPLHLDLWSALLSYVGYHVDCARNSFEAALRLSRGVQCIVLEHHVSDMRGVDFIRNFTAPGNPSFVLLTGDPDPFIHDRARQAGATATLLKPSSLNEVVDAIEQACNAVPHVGPLHYIGRMSA